MYLLCMPGVCQRKARTAYKRWILMENTKTERGGKGGLTLSIRRGCSSTRSWAPPPPLLLGEVRSRRPSIPIHDHGSGGHISTKWTMARWRFALPGGTWERTMDQPMPWQTVCEQIGGERGRPVEKREQDVWGMQRDGFDLFFLGDFLSKTSIAIARSSERNQTVRAS